MSTLRRRGLQIDDPLSPSQPSGRDEPLADEAGPVAEAIQSGRAGAEGPLSPPGQRPEPDGASRREGGHEGPLPARRVAGQADGGVWRMWSGIASVGSFRLPHELLVELGDTARELQLPIGMIVTAAITQLLDQPPDTIAALVDSAEDARIHGRRTARRRLSAQAGE